MIRLNEKLFLKRMTERMERYELCAEKGTPIGLCNICITAKYSCENCPLYSKTTYKSCTGTWGNLRQICENRSSKIKFRKDSAKRAIHLITNRLRENGYDYI